MIGMNHIMMTQYIKVVADNLLVALRCEPVYNETNPFPFMELLNLQNKTNFFEERVSEYAKPLSHSVDGERVFSTTEDF